MYDFGKEELTIAMRHLSKEELVLLYNERKLICEMFIDIIRQQEKKIETQRQEIILSLKVNELLEKRLEELKPKK